MEISRQNQIDLHVVLHLLLIAALVWLPMMGLTVDVFVEKQPSNVYLEKNVLTAGAFMVPSHYANAGHSMMHQSPQMNISSQKPSFSEEPIHTTGNDCAGHQAPCCSACVSYCSTSIFLLSSVTSPRIERCQQFSDSLTVVVLARDLRPPIA